MLHRILVSNLGYARDIDGSILRHLKHGLRHFRTSVFVQKNALDAYRQIIKDANPHLCCLIEVDTGSFTSGWFNQFSYLEDSAYILRDVVSKYAVDRQHHHLSAFHGKCNGIMANRLYAYERLYLACGSKRLLYRIVLEEGLTLFFTHLSLHRSIRLQQLKELRVFADKEKGDVLIAGDFNILAGVDELSVLCGDKKYRILNNPEEGTFTLFGKHYLLDVCIANCSAQSHFSVKVIDQPFSDHDALLVTVET